MWCSLLPCFCLITVLLSLDLLLFHTQWAEKRALKKKRTFAFLRKEVPPKTSRLLYRIRLYTVFPLSSALTACYGYIKTFLCSSPDSSPQYARYGRNIIQIHYLGRTDRNIDTNMKRPKCCRGQLYIFSLWLLSSSRQGRSKVLISWWWGNGFILMDVVSSGVAPPHPRGMRTHGNLKLWPRQISTPLGDFGATC